MKLPKLMSSLYDLCQMIFQRNFVTITLKTKHYAITIMQFRTGHRLNENNRAERQLRYILHPQRKIDSFWNTLFLFFFLFLTFLIDSLFQKLIVFSISIYYACIPSCIHSYVYLSFTHNKLCLNYLLCYLKKNQ